MANNEQCEQCEKVLKRCRCMRGVMVKVPKQNCPDCKESE